MIDVNDLWTFLPWGYLVTILIETPVLLFGLSRRHPLRDRLVAGVWLTACTYPIVVLALPVLVLEVFNWTWLAYLAVAETFAPLAECGLFWLAYGTPEERWRPSMWRDMAAVTVANLCSFGVGELLHTMEWL